MEHYAHSKEGEPEENWQTLKEHLEETANMAKEFASSFNAGEIAFYTGLLHDLGKYSQKFQKKIRGASIKVDHSTAGGLEAINLYGKGIGDLMAYCIVGHHTGLPDYGGSNQDKSLSKRLRKPIEKYSKYKSDLADYKFDKNLAFQELKSIKQICKKNKLFYLSFYTRMLFSCLKDADYLDTERFVDEAKFLQRSQYTKLPELYQILSDHLDGFKGSKGKVNEKRAEILDECLKKAESKRGLYSLIVPTGGGKTLSSLAFALNHAITNKMDRVIYAIPFTSIIEQNADVFRGVFGNDNVLEHHSNFLFENIEPDEENPDVAQKLKLATENWDMPIITTTNVQFFESLYSNKSSRTRKLHNIANSVIILDEAQMLPTDFLEPCLFALCELIANYNCTVVLCTATQPALGSLLPEGIKITEIMDNPTDLYDAFKRVEVKKIDKKLSDKELSEEILKNNQALCIVNTRKHARKLYSEIKDGDDAFHLSTLMCPVHRRDMIKDIKQRLKDKKDCRVVSTQLIEAGVDIDFPFVYRSSAGIDSIAQSAGRCNREGSLVKGIVSVFFTSEKHGKIQGPLKRAATVGDMILEKYDDVLSPEAIEDYFKQLYKLEDDFDTKKIVELLSDGHFKFNFAEAAREFNFINSANSYSIVIPYDDNAKKLIEDARNSLYPTSFTRKLRPYTVNIFENEYKALAGAFEEMGDAFIVLRDDDLYDKQLGLTIPEDLMFMNI